ncbi:hypothetical protein EJ110_NYTH51304 [Nymphaea thermarum]|nr:hypothetical protein EJ110_NYTH51304 [Nymphaea thermarum]
MEGEENERDEPEEVYTSENSQSRLLLLSASSPPDRRQPPPVASTSARRRLHLLPPVVASTLYRPTSFSTRLVCSPLPPPSERRRPPTSARRPTLAARSPPPDLRRLIIRSPLLVAIPSLHSPPSVSHHQRRLARSAFLFRQYGPLRLLCMLITAVTFDEEFPVFQPYHQNEWSNYEMWAMQVKRTLIAHDKEHLILEPEPVQKVGKYTTWFKDNSLVMVWIVGTLSQDIANEVLHKESAKDMWDSLAATYSQARNETRIMQLHHDIHQMRQDGRPLHTYYSSLKSMFERLNSYFPACKCEQQKAYRDMLMVGVFLSGLNSIYESAKNEMLTSPSIPPIDEAYSRLSRIPIPASTVPDTTSAMLATRGRGGFLFARGRGGRGRGNTTSRPVCQFCHRIGHTVDKCWQKHGRPAFANQTASTDSPEQPKAQHTASSSELRVDDIISQLRNWIGDRPQHAPDLTTSTITTAASASSSGMYSAYTVCPATDTTDWLIDSGASTHLCGDKAQFTSYVPAPPGEYHEHAHAPNDFDMLIAQRKGKRSCTLHPISGHLSMDRLTPTY